MIALRQTALLAILLAVSVGIGTAEDPKTDKPAEPPKESAKKDNSALEKQFADLLSKSVLVGKFTLDGKDGPPSEDRYEIGKAAKLKDDLWVFSGIKYGQKEIPLPLIIRVVWADETPMMTMDKLTIPGLGTFSFRLMFHGTRYAGTWQHDDHGGHMWGRVERQLAKPAKLEK